MDPRILNCASSITAPRALRRRRRADGLALGLAGLVGLAALLALYLLGAR